MARIKDLISESQRGAISIAYAMAVIIILFVLASALLTSVGTDLRGSNNRLIESRVFYAAESGLELAIKDLKDGGDGVISSVTITGVNVSTSITNDTVLTATATQSQISRSIQVIIYASTSIGGYNIYSTGTVSNVTSYDEDRNEDPSLMKQNQESMPSIAYSDLIDLASSQGHVVGGSTFSPSNNYPNGSFYYSPGVPNVIHVTGNMDVKGGRTIYGIYVVESDVDMKGSARMQGILYLPNSSSSFSVNGGGSPSESSVVGGVVVNGNISATGNHVSVQYKSEYTQFFANYETGGGGFTVAHWSEL